MEAVTVVVESPDVVKDLVKPDRHIDKDSLFSIPELMDDCIDAANRASRSFSPLFPGWQLYSRIARGDDLFDRQLTAWAIGCSRSYVRSRKINNHCVVAKRGRRNDWIAQAGVDALHMTIFGSEPESAYRRSNLLGCDDETFARVRNALYFCFSEGFDHYRAELHYQLDRVWRENARERWKNSSNSLSNNGKNRAILSMKGSKNPSDSDVLVSSCFRVSPCNVG